MLSGSPPICARSPEKVIIMNQQIAESDQGFHVIRVSRQKLAKKTLCLLNLAIIRCFVSIHEFTDPLRQLIAEGQGTVHRGLTEIWS